MGSRLSSFKDPRARRRASTAPTSASAVPPSASAGRTTAPSPTMPTAHPTTAADAEADDGDYSDMPALIPDDVGWLPSNFRGRAPCPPSPPARADSPPGLDAWNPGGADESGVLQPPWRYDPHPCLSGWDSSAQGHAAALLLNAAYDVEAALEYQLPPLDMRWHRPDERELSPFGNNQRGDIAPNVVHATLDDVLAPHPVTPLEFQLFHCWIDGVWMRHSRSQERCVEAVRRMDYFDEQQVTVLVAALVAEPLSDFRIIMHSVDPRARPVYGRTQDSEGRSRLFRMFPVTLQRPDRATWDEDDGDLSGSSRDGSDAESPFSRTPPQRIERRFRHLERRARRILPRIQAAERALDEVEQRLREAQLSLPDAQTLVAVLIRGLNGPVGSEHRERIWQGWS